MPSESIFGEKVALVWCVGAEMWPADVVKSKAWEGKSSVGALRDAEHVITTMLAGPNCQWPFHNQLGIYASGFSVFS